MFSIAVTQLTESAGKALATPVQFRAVHGDPAGWCAAEIEEYLTACDAVTAAQAADTDPCAVEFGTETGQDALRDIIATLAETAETDVDAEDLAHYRQLLAAPVTRLPRRRTTEITRGCAA